MLFKSKILLGVCMVVCSSAHFLIFNFYNIIKIIINLLVGSHETTVAWSIKYLKKELKKMSKSSPINE